MENNFTALEAKDVLHLFTKYRERKNHQNQYYVSCPFHENDDNPSLLIKDSWETGEHKLLVNCFGCGVDKKRILDYINSGGSTILDKITLEEIAGGRKPKKLENLNYKLTETYTYKKRDGSLNFQILRYDDKEEDVKKFSFRRPSTQEENEEGLGDWIWSREDFNITLYNLDLIEAVQKKGLQTPIFIVEGEGKADLLRSVRLVGTCNPFGGGNGKFLPEFAEELKDSNVVLIPDNDIPGYVHIYGVAEIVLPFVRSLKILELPRLRKYKEDIKEWFSKYDGSKDELLQLLSDAEELKDKSIEYIREKYPFNFTEQEEPELDTSLLDALIAEGQNECEYSPKLQGFLERGRAILEAQGNRIGLCEFCLGTGFVLGKNFDGFPAIIAQKSVDMDSENTSVILSTCNHGEYVQNAEDFNY